MGVHVFGIRHHGPGSARSLSLALAQLAPDCVLIEGPPDADPLIPLLGSEAMQPPIAILIHAKADPTKAMYFPLASFSPELHAARYALSRGVAVRFMDLPAANQLAEDDDKREKHERRLRRDPLSYIAEAAGYDDSERWWEHMVEERQDGRELFDAIRYAMVSLRRELAWDAKLDVREARREAYMRKVIRAAMKDGHEEIAVVCGAWHVPALIELPTQKADTQVLRGMPKTKVESTFIPWTHGRLAVESGYGAGVRSPGWYQHLFETNDDIVIAWMTKVARTLRDEGLDVSADHVIESVRLAEALASLRGRPLPGLDEMNEAVRTVMMFGDAFPLRLVRQRLIIGEALGGVPGETPMVPLMRDLAKQQKTLRMPAEATEKEYVLDLRKSMHLQRSVLLRRLDLLGVPWGVGGDRGEGLGTFKERWQVCWEPELAIRLIEAGAHGGTIEAASSALVKERAAKEEDVAELTNLARRVILADLPDAVGPTIDQLEARAAVAADLTHLMAAIPDLAQLVRYGDVRGTDTTVVAHVLDDLATRVCVGLKPACSGLGDDAADEMFTHIMNVHGAIGLLGKHRESWLDALYAVAKADTLPGLLRGRAVRLCFDAKKIDREEVGRRFSHALSTAGEPSRAAAFADGFLRGSGQILVYDESLWSILDEWLDGLTDDAFVPVLPLLRRTFSTFTGPERRQMSERADLVRERRVVEAPIDPTRGMAAMPLVRTMLGLEP